MKSSGWLFRLALRFAPRWYRERHGAEVLETHRRRLESAAGAGLGFRLREVAGVLRLAIVLRAKRSSVAAPVHAPVRGRASGRVFDGVLRDVRFAVRTLLRSPAYTATAVVVLGLGIAASTAIFSAINAYFFRPLPFADPDRLVMLYETNPEYEWTDVVSAPANMMDWRDQVSAFDDVAGYSEFVGRVSFVAGDEPVQLKATSVTGNFFDLLGVQPLIGRGFRWEETWADGTPVVVLSHALWVSHFGADPGVIGRTYEFGGRRSEVVGVMPAGFTFPSAETQLWYQWGWVPANRDEVWFRRAHFVRAFARLAPGVTMQEAEAQLQTVVSRLQRAYPETNSVMGAGLTPMRDFLIRSVKRPLLILFGAVGLLLLLACANVANLTLVRGAERAREMALRHALGAGRLRVARQLLTENLLLALAAGAVGTGIGWAGVRAIERLGSAGIEGATSIALDVRVIAFTLLATLASGILFGVVPAIRATAGRLQGTLIEGGTASSAGRRGLRTVHAFVIAEVTLALLLVTGAGLMMRSFLLIRDVDPGFRTDGVLAVQVTAPASRYAEAAEVIAFQDHLVETLESRAGIERVGLIGQLPLTATSWSSQFQAAGWPPDRVGFEIVHRRASPGYFDALDIPLIRGRMFEPHEDADAPYVVVINETFAREHFPGEDPIGQRIAYDRAANESSIWYEIVGIVGDQHQVSPVEPVRAEVFENYRQDWARTQWIVMRTSGEPMSVLPTVRSVLREIDPLIPLGEARPLREVWRASMAREEFILTLLTIFATVALLLAAVGVYAVTAQAARTRTRELGIRMALGAESGELVMLMLRRTLALVAIGVAVGLTLSLVASRALAAVLFGIGPNDPLTLAAVVVVLTAASGVACYLPARRATGLDPVRSLR